MGSGPGCACPGGSGGWLFYPPPLMLLAFGGFGLRLLVFVAPRHGEEGAAVQAGPAAQRPLRWTAVSSPGLGRRSLTLLDLTNDLSAQADLVGGGVDPQDP